MEGEQSGSLAAAIPPSLVDLTLLVGDPAFGDALVTLVEDMADVGHVLVFAFDEDRLVPLMAASHDAQELIETATRRFMEDYLLIDPLVPEVRIAADSASPRLFRADPQAMPHRELFELLEGPRSVSERLVVAGRAARLKMAVSLVRVGRRDRLDAATADRLLYWFPIILALIASHSRLTVGLSDASRAFASVEAIEQGLADCGLSLRQLQVCARILFGMSTEGISIDLNIGMETVITHRKQAYQRLGIANQFELTRWYLGLLPAWRKGEGR